MTGEPPPPPRPVLDMSGGQLGDTRIEAAGRDRINQGLTGEEVNRLLQNQQEFGLTLVAAYEKLYTDLSAQVRNIRHDVELRFAIDEGKRRGRQRTLDLWLALITLALVIMAVGWLFLLVRLWPALTAVALALGGAQ